MVGNKRAAALAVDNRLDLIDDSGGDRRVYRSDDTVYKVERNPDHGRWANEAEYSNSVTFAGERNVPPTSLYRVGDVTVLAMPFYPCPTDPFPEGTHEILALRARFIDVINVNTRRDREGNLWIVDFPGLVSSKRVKVDAEAP